MRATAAAFLRGFIYFAVGLIGFLGADVPLSAFDGHRDDMKQVAPVTALPVTALPAKGGVPGRTHYMLQVGWRNTGEPLEVPVIDIVGAVPGKSFLLTAAVHGDELNGIAVLHDLAERLTPDEISGRIILVPGLNRPGMEANSRYFTGSGGGGFQADLNRLFPGRVDGGHVGEKYIGAFWDGVVRDRIDMAIDLHTQTRGTAYPLFVFADFRNEKAKEMAHLLAPDVIKNDPGQEGTFETTLIAHKIPAVTLEVGEPKRFQPELIARAVDGIIRVLKAEGILQGAVEAAKDLSPKPIVGESYTNVSARRGGVVRMEVSLLQAVKEGQIVARQYGPFGQLIDVYRAPHDGHVLALATDPLREEGGLLVRILK